MSHSGSVASDMETTLKKGNGDRRAGGTTVDGIPKASVSSVILVVQVEDHWWDDFDGVGVDRAAMVANTSSGPNMF